MFLCPRCSAPCGEGHSFCFACGSELKQEHPREDPLLGRTLPGGYRVTHLVGVGGMGRVYCAEQVNLGRTVAVKVVHPHLADDELTVARFLNEARAASRLSHPNSVAIFDFGRTEQGQPYIVMEYLKGRDLARVVHEEGPLPIARIADTLRQTLGALEEAHALGIVHRDLKPDNIVLEPLRSGLDFVKVVDFGLAKIFEESPAPSSARGALTRPGLVCGTPEYMSPEQGRGDPLDGRADLYSLGVVLFEVLTGHVPFQGDNATKTLLMQLTEAPPDPRVVAPGRGIPDALAELTLKALAKHRDERPADARAFAEALASATTSRPESRRGADFNPTTGIRCRACGSINALGQKFCGECGVPGAASEGKSPSPPAAGSTAPRPEAGPTVARTPAVGGAQGTLPLLGRADALEWLESRRHEAQAAFALAHVIGESGLGKTRLVQEFAERCTSRGDVVVPVGPHRAWAKVGGAALRDAISGLTGTPAGPPDASSLGAADRARRGLQALWIDAPDVSPADRRLDAAEALRWALGVAVERAAGKLVMLVVDDVDYVDGVSGNAFADIVANSPTVDALFVIASAPASRGVGEPLAGESWQLAPLSPEAFERVLPADRGLAEDRPLSPLHLEQLLAWVAETREPAPDALPELVVRRAARLPPDARHALHALAVWGEDTTPTVLAGLLPPGADVAAALDALGRARFCVTDDKGTRIAHPLVRRLVLSTLPAGRKRELFARSAALRTDAPIEIRARQAVHGGSALEALSLLEILSARRAAAGDVAGQVSSLRTALELARRELHRGELDDPMAAMLVFSRKLAEALAASGNLNDADGVLREALGNAPPTSSHRARLLGVLARVAHDRSRPDEARRYIAEAKRVARASDAHELMPLLEQLAQKNEVA